MNINNRTKWNKANPYRVRVSKGGYSFIARYENEAQAKEDLKTRLKYGGTYKVLKPKETTKKKVVRRTSTPFGIPRNMFRF